jgi:hypothetical protein
VSDVAELFEGAMPVRMMPISGRPFEIRTPRLLPPRFEALEYAAPSMVEVDRWQANGFESIGTWTAEQWVHALGTDLPEDLDPETWTIPVRLLAYVRVSE